MWQVQWNTGDNRLQVPLSLESLVSSEEEKTVDFFFILQQTYTISFCLTKLTDGRGKFNGA